MNYDKYLPIGSVIMLKGGKKRIMIVGFCSISRENKNKIYDYSGCLYPEGLISTDQVLLFDHSQIDKIYHIGLVDDEEKKFKIKLNDVIKQVQTFV